MTERWKPLHAASAKELDVLMRSLLDRAEKAEAENEALRAREQAVRDVCNVAVHVNDHPDVAVGWLEATASVLRALDGDA
jgi:hypothetical protein